MTAKPKARTAKKSLEIAKNAKYKRMAESAKSMLMAIIADEDTVTGFLLAGIGEKSPKGERNFLIVDSDTKVSTVEQTFVRFTEERTDIAVILLSQRVANDIRPLLSGYSKSIPTILEIPSKDSPYDPDQDSVMGRVKQLLGKD